MLSRRLLRLFASIALAVPLSVTAALPAPESVTFPSLDIDANGKPITVPALLFRPAAAQGRVPLIIALHGCGGMYSAAPGRESELALRSIEWTERLLADGYAVLWPDSFTPRGAREICTMKESRRPIRVSNRRLDELGALVFAASQPGIDRDRIALVGWSNGGSTTLATINRNDPKVLSLLARPDAPPFFRTAVAFYPGCQPVLAAGAGWHITMPTAIHIGASDDWTPAGPCEDLGVAASLRDEPLTVTVYPDSHHGFDGPGSKLTVLKNIPGGIHPGQGVTVGPNPATRAEVIPAVRSFLREQLAPPR